MGLAWKSISQRKPGPDTVIQAMCDGARDLPLAGGEESRTEAEGPAAPNTSSWSSPGCPSPGVANTNASGPAVNVNKRSVPGGIIGNDDGAWPREKGRAPAPSRRIQHLSLPFHFLFPLLLPLLSVCIWQKESSGWFLLPDGQTVTSESYRFIGESRSGRRMVSPKATL